MTKLLTAAALAATITASLPVAARACESIASMSARIIGGSPIGGVPCIPATPTAPAAAVRGLSGGIPGGVSPQAVMGAVGVLGGILGALQSNDQPAASPAAPAAPREAPIVSLWANSGPYTQAENAACSGDATSVACLKAEMAFQEYMARGFCSPAMQTDNPGAASQCQDYLKMVQDYHGLIEYAQRYAQSRNQTTQFSVPPPPLPPPTRLARRRSTPQMCPTTLTIHRILLSGAMVWSS
jgi:hypothetical protein